MNLKDLILNDELPSFNEVNFCIGLGYITGYNNPIIISNIERTAHASNPKIIGTLEKIPVSATPISSPVVSSTLNTCENTNYNNFYKLFAIGACWPYIKTIPEDLKEL